MKILLIEPYYTGSHQAWADGYQAHSRHEIELLTLPGRFWKWRMQGGALTLARQALELDSQPDLILASDMLNLPVFLSLHDGLVAKDLTSADRARLSNLPVAFYFHENQLTYPLQPGEKRDLHYGFINFVSALRADAVFFNSAYHLDTFFDELPRLLKHFPDYTELWAVDGLRTKSRVLPLGLDLSRFAGHALVGAAADQQADSRRPVILWNHRWEYDKDPETFFRAIYALAGEAADSGPDFGLIILGESFRNEPAEFLVARDRLAQHLLHFGYAQDRAAYARLLGQADIVVSTALHEFFGAAVVEACYCGCFPVLPRRLAYPELIPEEYHARCLYEDFGGLLGRLRRALHRVEETRAFSLQPHMARFDWTRMAPLYDEVLEQVSSQGAAVTVS
jgi:glycosyltransferase involved in cell wall biosynthesis